MRKLALCMMTYLIVSLSFTRVSADGTDIMNNNARIEQYVANLYNGIDFGKGQVLSYEAFTKAYRGYLNLRNAGKLNTDQQIISVCDMSLSSTKKRLWVIDLNEKKVLFNTYVAHGSGSGDEYASAFSNRENTHQSSLGFYVTGDTYEGEHGTSLHLAGMDEGFNDAAYDRGIVVHGAPYVSEDHIKSNDYLGRSWGCPAVPAKLSLPIINTIKNGTCLFIYYPDKTYLQSGYWVNKAIASLPDNGYGSVAVPVIAQ